MGSTDKVEILIIKVGVLNKCFIHRKMYIKNQIVKILKTTFCFVLCLIGNKVDWWTSMEDVEFAKRSNCLVKQYNEFKVEQLAHHIESFNLT